MIDAVLLDGFLIDSALLLKLLGATISALVGLILLQWRQLVGKIDKSEAQLSSRMAEFSNQRQRTTDDVRETREQVIRISERLEAHAKNQDKLMEDFKERFEKSDTLHLQILTRLGRLILGKTPSPMDALSEEEVSGS